MPGIKFDTDKPDLTLVPYEFSAGAAHGLAFGLRKYERHNYLKGMSHTRLAAAVMRHLSKWASGEDLDPEAVAMDCQVTHLELACSALAMLMANVGRHPHLDDRGYGDDDEIARLRSEA